MIIVIHPGSLNLRIGRGGDTNPVTITHAVAVRRRKGAQVHRDAFLPATVHGSSLVKDVISQVEDARLRMSHLLQSSLQGNGNRRYATPPQQISAFNRRSTPEEVPANPITDIENVWLGEHLDRVVGDDIYKLSPDAEYNIHFPIKRGLLNLHNGIGGSLLNVLDQLEMIWEYAITAKLGISLKELSQYKAILVIPDIFNRTHSKEMTNLLLNRLGFDSCFLVQDHVAAMFGCGLSSACVVDIGAEKTSISCVDEGASQASTRVCLEYGGSDITILFLWLLKKCSFPYKECSLESPMDFRLLNELKEKCHLNLDICGAQEHSFRVMLPGRPIHEYTLQFGDELLIAPLSLFHTELLNLSGPIKSARTQAVTKAVADAEDCFDGNFLRDTGIPKRKDQVDDAEDEDIVDLMDSEEFFLAGSQIIGIDQAILQSIERCPTDEMRKKMSVVLVGGGSKFPCAEKYLQSRLANHIQLNCISTSSKDIDPATATWKGAAIMSNLESAAELFITKSDWDKQGIKILRERAPFMW